MADKPNLLAEKRPYPRKRSSQAASSRREKLDRLRDMKQALAKRANETDLSMDRAEQSMAEIEIAIARVRAPAERRSTRRPPLEECRAPDRPQTASSGMPRFSLISSMTKDADTSASGTFRISCW